MPDAVGQLVQLSMHHFAKYCCNLLAQGRSERQVKRALSEKVKGKADPNGAYINMVFERGCALYAEQKRKELPVIVLTDGNHNN